MKKKKQYIWTCSRCDEQITDSTLNKPKNWAVIRYFPPEENNSQHKSLCRPCADFVLGLIEGRDKTVEKRILELLKQNLKKEIEK